MEQPEPPAEPAMDARDRAVLSTGRAIGSLFLALGILGALRTGMDETAQLTIFTVSPAIAGVWLVLGLVGTAMTAGVRRCRRYLQVAGALLVLWGVLGAVVDGGPDELFVRDGPLIALHLITGAICLVAAMFPRRRAAAADLSPTPPSTPSGARD